MAKACGCQRIYKYANDYGDKKTLTDYFRVEKPGDDQSLRRSPYVHNIVLVYDNGVMLSDKKSSPRAG